jgi:acetoacetyl-CoA synthetase
VLQFQKLAAGLKIDRPIYALQARGADLRQQPHATIAEMASAYIDAIREVQPNGPYALAGYSFGGLVAFEMGCRLREMGEVLDLLALFETDVSSRILLPTERLLGHWMLVRRNMRELAGQPRRRWTSFLMEKGTVVWRRVVWRRDFIRELDDSALDLSETVRARNRQLYESGDREFAAYRPRHYPGTLAIFRTADPTDPLLFWRRAADRVDVFNIAGKHGTIMDDPNVASLAAQLRLYLDRSDLEPVTCVRGGSASPVRDATLVPKPLGKIADPAR